MAAQPAVSLFTWMDYSERERRKALDVIDEIIETIRSSADVAEARKRLSEKFKLSEIQANAILEMRLQRLTGLEREKVKTEYDRLMEEIARAIEALRR